MGNSESNIDKNEKVETVKLIKRSCKRVFGSNINHEAILINNKYIVENGVDNENYDKYLSQDNTQIRKVESNELIYWDQDDEVIKPDENYTIQTAMNAATDNGKKTVYDIWNFFNDKRNICWDTAKRVKDSAKLSQNERESKECQSIIGMVIILCICFIFVKVHDFFL